MSYNNYTTQEGLAGIDVDRAARPIGWHADWRLTIEATTGGILNVSVDTLGNPATPNPVPEPATASFVAATLLLLTRRPRRRVRH